MANETSSKFQHTGEWRGLPYVGIDATDIPPTAIRSPGTASQDITWRHLQGRRIVARTTLVPGIVTFMGMPLTT
jgi:hypothetical protein